MEMESITPDVQEEHSDDDDESIDDDTATTLVFAWLLVFSVMMFTLPFLAFYGTKEWLKNSFEIVGFPNNCYSALAAVVVVNVIISLYAMLAFNEDCSKKRRINKKNK